MIIEQCYREELPYISIWQFKPWLIASFGFGFIHLLNGFSIEYRHKPLKKLMILRVLKNGCQSGWRNVQMVRNRSNLSISRFECPFCCACVDTIWLSDWANVIWTCKTCNSHPTARKSNKLSKFRKAIRSEDWSALKRGLEKGGMTTLDARLAMEQEQLTPRMFSVEAQTKGNLLSQRKLFKKHRARQRFRCRIARGRLLYVEGRLYVR